MRRKFSRELIFCGSRIKTRKNFVPHGIFLFSISALFLVLVVIVFDAVSFFDIGQIALALGRVSLGKTKPLGKVSISKPRVFPGVMVLKLRTALRTRLWAKKFNY